MAGHGASCDGPVHAQRMSARLALHREPNDWFQSARNAHAMLVLSSIEVLLVM